MVAKFTPIIPQPLDERQLLDGMMGAVKEEVKESDKLFGKTYRTFRHKPGFTQSFSESSIKIEGQTATRGEGSKQNPYPFVAKGTSVRYATMTPDFKAKTKKRFIGSGSGSGGVAYIDKRRPRPGIEAREFEEEIAEQEQPKFQKRGQQYLDRAAKKSKHAT